MSESYIVIYPKNPILANPQKELVILGLKESGFLASEDVTWESPDKTEKIIFNRPGFHFRKYYGSEEVTGDLEKGIIEFRQFDKIEIEVFAPGEFNVVNPETGTELGDEWGYEVGKFLEDNSHQWTDPENNKSYYFFELNNEKEIALGKHFLIVDNIDGEPNEKLMELMKNITGFEYDWMWRKI
jgi:hypothetical protein